MLSNAFARAAEAGMLMPTRWKVLSSEMQAGQLSPEDMLTRGS
jgi:hypothetical protein